LELEESSMDAETTALEGVEVSSVSTRRTLVAISQMCTAVLTVCSVQSLNPTNHSPLSEDTIVKKPSCCFAGSICQKTPMVRSGSMLSYILTMLTKLAPNPKKKTTRVLKTDIPPPPTPTTPLSKTPSRAE
jgi:hypothetical protein